MERITKDIIMRGPEKLLENENRWETCMGGLFVGERVVYRGQDLHVDLGDMSWIELHLYGITGRRFPEAQLKVLNAILTYSSFPEPRIWPNRVAALAGTARSTGNLGVSSATAVSEATIYGGKAIVMATDFILKTMKWVDDGGDFFSTITRVFNEHSYAHSYGRPIAHTDERISHFMKKLKSADLDQGKHVLLAFEIEKILLKFKEKLYINYTGLIAAVAADIGFTPRQFYLFCLPMFINGMIPCSIDTTEKCEGTFFPLRCSSIVYEGNVRHRLWNSLRKGQKK